MPDMTSQGTKSQGMTAQAQRSALHEQVLTDLASEGDALADVIAGVDLRTPTPAAGWSIADQLAHLAWTDDQAIMAITDPARFTDELAAALQRDPARAVDDAAHEGARSPELIPRWQAGRTALATVLAQTDLATPIVWFGPPMTATSMATARLMETWAHGCDIRDAVGLPIPATDRLRHIVHLGVRTRDFAYLLRDQTPPEPFRIELLSPTGELWSYGPAQAAQRVTGSATDFCLLITQRRHRDDLDLRAVGADAQGWLEIAQCFAGMPGAGRDPLSSQPAAPKEEGTP